MSRKGKTKKGVEGYKGVEDYFIDLQKRALKKHAGDISDLKLIYRGVSKLKYELHSSAYQRLVASKLIRKNKTPNILTLDIMQAHMEELINQVKLNAWDRKETERSLEDLEILALLRHYGAAVCLMDWTWSFHIALWFACCDDLTSEGKVHFVDIKDIGPAITHKDLERNIFSFISEPGSESKPYYWEAASLTDRIPRQNSVFLLGKEPFLDTTFNEIRIKAKHKKHILQELEAFFNTKAESLFKDLFGFADNNKAKNRLESKYLDHFVDGTLQKEPNKAIEAYTKAIKCNPNAVAAYYNRGSAKEQKKDFHGAIKDYDQAIRLKPDYAAAYTNRGVAKAQKGDFDDAIEDFIEAIRLKPDDAQAYYNRGLAKAKKGDFVAAIKDFSEAIRLKPDFSEAYNNRSLAKQNNNDFTGVIEGFDQAIHFKPNNVQAYNNRGLAKAKKGDLAGAIKDYNQAIRLKPDYADAYSNRGIAKRQKGDFAGAIKDYSEAIRLKSDNAEAYNNRGFAKARKGDLAGAIKDLDKAIRLRPKLAEAYASRGNAKREKGDLEGAIKDFEQAIKYAEQQGKQGVAKIARKGLEDTKQLQEELKKQQGSNPDPEQSAS